MKLKKRNKVHTHSDAEKASQLSIEAWNWHPSQMPFATWIWWLWWLDVGFIKVHLFHVSSNADAGHFCLCAMCTNRNTASILFILYKIEWKLRVIITCITHLCNDYRCGTHTPRLLVAKVRIIIMNDIYWWTWTHAGPKNMQFADFDRPNVQRDRRAAAKASSFRGVNDMRHTFYIIMLMAMHEQIDTSMSARGRGPP